MFKTRVLTFQVVGALGVQEAARPHTKGESEAEGAERPGESGATAGEIHILTSSNIQFSEICSHWYMEISIWE